MNDPVDPAALRSGTILDVVHDLLGSVLGMLDHGAVIVRHVEGPVRSRGGEHRPEPTVGRGEKLGVVVRAAGHEGRPVGDEQVAVHDVVDRVAGERRRFVTGRKPPTRVDRNPTRRREPAVLRVMNILRFSRDLKQRRGVLVVRDGMHRRRIAEIRIAAEVRLADDHMAQMVVVPNGETITPGIESVPVLGVARHGFDQPRSRLKANVARTHIDGRLARVGREAERATPVAELLGVADRRGHARVGGVDPIIDAV